MRKYVLASVLLLASSTAVCAEHLGLRVGGGLGTGIEDYSYQDNDNPQNSISTDPSITLELGYDFNDIFALNVKGASTHFKSSSTNEENRGQGTIYEVAVEAEVGYTFVFDGDTLIKPYTAIGAVTFDKETSSKLLGENHYAQTARGALGVRTTLDNGVYFDGRIQSTDFTAKGKSLSAKLDLVSEGRITVGYRF